jgi:hypothetical protein
MNQQQRSRHIDYRTHDSTVNLRWLARQQAAQAAAYGPQLPAMVEAARGRTTCSACGIRVLEELGYERAYCHGCAPCDECEHPMRAHLSLYGIAADDDPRWAQATCWASSICSSC